MIIASVVHYGQIREAQFLDTDVPPRSKSISEIAQLALFCFVAGGISGAVVGYFFYGAPVALATACALSSLLYPSLSMIIGKFKDELNSAFPIYNRTNGSLEIPEQYLRNYSRIGSIIVRQVVFSLLFKGKGSVPGAIGSMCATTFLACVVAPLLILPALGYSLETAGGLDDLPFSAPLLAEPVYFAEVYVE